VNQSALKNYRGRFPFRLATTSYIFPDRIVPNVAKLAPSFDEIELVLFESESQDSLVEEEEIEALRKLSLHHDVNFNIHLPLDLFLGDKSKGIRLKGISALKKMIERTVALNPSIYTLHLERRDRNGREESSIGTWRWRVLQSIEEILRWGIEPNRISIEILDYPFEWIEDIVEESGFSICLDIGHILICGRDLRSYLDKYLAKTSIIHLHGFRNGVNHLGLDQLPESVLKLILSHLHHYQGIVSLEVFSIEDLKISLVTLEEKWGRR
jgi:sugar phosphate isomerase/epimerase